MKKPNFFIVGEPKCGTIAIYCLLKQHPEIYLPEQKELHHFEKDLNDERRNFEGRLSSYYNYGLEDYLKHFKDASEKMVGDVTPYYLLSKVAAEEIYKFNPKAKIIALFREPVSFIESWHAQLDSEYREDKDLKTAIELEGLRKKGRELPKYCLMPSMVIYSKWIKYAEQLERYLKLFPKEQIKVIFFENFKKDNAGVVRSLFRFLGVDENFKPESGERNPRRRLRHKAPWIIYRSAAHSFIGRFIRFILPFRLSRGIGRTVAKFAMKSGDKNEISPEFRGKLMKKYASEVKKLNALLHSYGMVEDDFDLVSFWGYDRIGKESGEQE